MHFRNFGRGAPPIFYLFFFLMGASCLEVQNVIYWMVGACIFDKSVKMGQPNGTWYTGYFRIQQVIWYHQLITTKSVFYYNKGKQISSSRHEKLRADCSLVTLGTMTGRLNIWLEMQFQQSTFSETQRWAFDIMSLNIAPTKRPSHQLRVIHHANRPIQLRPSQILVVYWLFLGGSSYVIQCTYIMQWAKHQARADRLVTRICQGEGEGL